MKNGFESRTASVPRRLATLGLALVLIAISATLLGQETGQDPPKPEKLFDTTKTLKVSITASWRKIERKEKYQGTYPATINYSDSLGNSVSHELTVERRGITRQRVCRYPPIKLRFEKANVKGSTFRGQKSLKMVTHCDKSSRFEQYYIMEMLAYRMYNLITDKSFKVRPLEIDYVDSDTGKTDEGRFAFLIEDDSDVADRFDLKKLRIPKIKATQLDPAIMSDFSLFQYMIGNVDWAALSGPDPKECCHNVKLIGPKPLQPGDLAIALPYDFDSSGIVDAHYAAPPNGLPIGSVTQRLYRGYCLHNPTMEEARSNILGQKMAIFELLDKESRLNSKTRNKAKRYLEKYFEILEDPEEFNDDIIEKCRK